MLWSINKCQESTSTTSQKTPGPSAFKNVIQSSIELWDLANVCVCLNTILTSVHDLHMERMNYKYLSILDADSELRWEYQWNAVYSPSNQYSQAWD